MKQSVVNIHIHMSKNIFASVIAEVSSWMQRVLFSDLEIPIGSSMCGGLGHHSNVVYQCTRELTIVTFSVSSLGFGGV